MKCPKCGAEMESGWIQGGQRIIWTPEKHILSLIPRSDGRDIEWKRSYFAIPSAEAHCCRGCGFILMPMASRETGNG
ncbi:MAG: PF20097 family protein [Clostridiales bacterium]|jgi:hypothetical protein|nr:PF20097 family protein [Clostridiales bacterium]